MTSTRNVTVQGIIFEGCYTCLFARGSSELLLFGNEMRGCDTVLYMDDCRNCSVIGNWLHGNDGAGLFVLSSQNLFVSYNNITGTSARRHGAWVTVSDSTFTKNTFADNFIGIYLYGENKNNQISQNNFVNNTHGVAIMNTGAGTCINNFLVNNYWDNVGEDALNVDVSNPADQSPATHPVTVTFDSTQYPPPIATVTPQTNESTKDPLQQNQSLLLAASALTITALTVCALLLYYIKQRKRSCQP